MFTATIHNGPVAPAAPAAATRGLGERFIDMLVRMGERSSGARAARTYAYLNSLSDEELARRGLTREGLLDHCFRHLAVY